MEQSFTPLTKNLASLRKVRSFIRRYNPECRYWTDYQCDQLMACLTQSTRKILLEMAESGVEPADFWEAVHEAKAVKCPT